MILFSNQNNHVLKVKFAKKQFFLEFYQAISSASFRQMKMWFDSRFCNYNSIDLKWVLFEIISSTAIHDTRINQIFLRKKIKVTTGY